MHILPLTDLNLRMKRSSLYFRIVPHSQREPVERLLNDREAGKNQKPRIAHVQSEELRISRRCVCSLVNEASFLCILHHSLTQLTCHNCEHFLKTDDVIVLEVIRKHVSYSLVLKTTWIFRVAGKEWEELSV